MRDVVGGMIIFSAWSSLPIKDVTNAINFKWTFDDVDCQRLRISLRACGYQKGSRRKCAESWQEAKIYANFGLIDVRAIPKRVFD